jgi:hypothetical protein
VTADIRVLLDAQAFPRPHGGIPRYFTSRIAELRARPELGMNAVTPFRYVNSDHLLNLDPARYKRTRLANGRRSFRTLHALNSGERTW